ncbi:SCO family protein [Acidocella sp.]|uniref:SCO family protein n=1 Tax=Acidocella sp. TaxID=50710 RepID=UPI00263862E5|nr:SCO family protein [Acidocella sp.]
MRALTVPLFGLALLALTACKLKLVSPNDIDVQGVMPDLSFQMTDAATAKPLTAAALRGRTVLLYFGYTHCPDVCPATLFDLTRIEKQMGPAAAHLTILFVTVDPDRDNLALLAQYAAIFGPNVIGLRGTPDQLASLARRYRVAYSVTKTPVYSVSHTSSIYVFNAQGKAAFIIAGLDLGKPDITGIAQDLTSVVNG